MTPELVVAGGVSPGDATEFVHAAGDESSVNLRYGALEKQPEATGTYFVRVEPWRLSAVVRRTERGWIATSGVLNALGYGETPETAVEDLLDSVEQYLEFIRDDEPALAPAIAHHSEYVALLGMPRGTWLASVTVDAPAVE